MCAAVSRQLNYGLEIIEKKSEALFINLLRATPAHHPNFQGSEYVEHLNMAKLALDSKLH